MHEDNCKLQQSKYCFDSAPMIEVFGQSLISNIKLPISLNSILLLTATSYAVDKQYYQYSNIYCLVYWYSFYIVVFTHHYSTFHPICLWNKFLYPRNKSLKTQIFVRIVHNKIYFSVVLAKNSCFVRFL